MQIYHYHSENHYYIGVSQADPSPLEPGKYLIPAYATSESVPEFDPEVERVRWVEGVWLVEPIPELIPEPTPEPEPTPDWPAFFMAVQGEWLLLTEQTTNKTDTLILLLSRMETLTEASIPLLILSWNHVVGGLPPDHGIDWSAIASAAAEHHCPLFPDISDSGMLG